MKRRLLLPMLLLLAGMQTLFAQTTNTATTITMNSYSFDQGYVCSWNNVPSSGPGVTYKMYIEFEDGDNFGVRKRLPVSPTEYYTCTVTTTSNSFGPNIFIDAPGATFPTTTNTSLGWDLSETVGEVHLINTSTNVDKWQRWEYSQFVCPPLPIYISSFTYSVLSDRLLFSWTAVDESDYLSHYVLQKSNNNFTWVDDVLEPAQTGLGNHNYTVNVNKPGYPWMWYRLKWIRESNIVRYSTSIQVFNTGSTPTNIVCNYTNIKGPDSACASQSKVYKVHNVPASAGAYTWSVTGGSVTSTEQNGLKANVSFSSPNNATVYANSANNSCNKSKAVAVGGTGYVTVNSNMISTNSTSTHYVLSVNNLWPGTIGSQYNWYLSGGYVGSGQSWSFYVSPGLCVNVTVSANTACGLVSGASNLCYVEPPPCDPWCEPCVPCDDPPIDPRIGVSPVPAKDILTVTIRPDEVKDIKMGKLQTTPSYTCTVQLYDVFGNLQLERKDVSLKTPLQLDVRNLPVGNYILYIKNAKYKFSRHVRIQR